MISLGNSYRALVIGASGSIGHAFVSALRLDPACAEVVALSRSSHPKFSLESEASIAEVAKALTSPVPFSFIVDATGALTIDGNGPEKSLNALSAERLMRNFQINAVGPALLLKYFVPLLANKRVIYAKLSARVGSISDNKKGGWYGYRASKAALNMLLQTAAIELNRKNPAAVLVALQPGTVQSSLSTPFVKQELALSAHDSVRGLLQALDQCGTDVAHTDSQHNGAYFIDYQSKPISW